MKNINIISTSLEGKKCSKCKIVKSIKDFRKDLSKKDGYYSSCNNCYRRKYGMKKRTYNFYWRDLPASKSGEYLAVKHKRIHRIVAEEKLGRKLKKNEEVHHLNGDKYDNRPENLEILDRRSHHYIHLKKMWSKREYHLDEQKIKEYFNMGLGEKFISRLFNVYPVVIRTRLKRLGLKRDNSYRATKETFKIFNELRKKLC